MHLSHRIIAILIIFWIPFCCCSIKALASMACGEDAAAVFKAGCCTPSECTSSEQDSDEVPDEGDGCAGCCDRFSPEGAERMPLPGVDEIGCEPLASSVPPADPPGADAVRGAGPEARPPDPPPSSLLDLRCQLRV
ncbi:MAG: hypothetical protein VX641_01765 [Planctomycetota bacterium]|nr:hypothetical protein [Planctomycetota bacterium]